MQYVEEVVMSMPLGKAPGLDGFTTSFFRACWYTKKEEAHAIVEDLRKDKAMMGAFNATFLTLISKEEGTDTLDIFQPISLGNMIYKIISKVLDNRLKPLLPLLVSPNQLGYV